MNEPFPPPSLRHYWQMTDATRPDVLRMMRSTGEPVTRSEAVSLLVRLNLSPYFCGRGNRSRRRAQAVSSSPVKGCLPRAPVDNSGIGSAASRKA